MWCILNSAVAANLVANKPRFPRETEIAWAADIWYCLRSQSSIFIKDSSD